MAARKNRGQTRHSLGLDVGNVPTTDVDESQRTMVRGRLFDQPGTTERRAPEGKVRASTNRLDKAPEGAAQPSTASVRAERKAAEKAAEEANARPLTPEEMFAQLRKEVEGKQRAKEVAKQRITGGREDFRWQVDRKTGEAEYIRTYDDHGLAWHATN